MSLTWRQVSTQNTGDPSSLMAQAGYSLDRGMDSLERLGAQFQKGNMARKQEEEQIAIGKLKQALAGKSPDEIQAMRNSGQLQQMAQGFGVTADDSYTATNTVKEDVWNNVINRLDKQETEASINQTKASTNQTNANTGQINAVTAGQQMANEQTEKQLNTESQISNVVNPLVATTDRLLSQENIKNNDGNIKGIVSEIETVYDTALQNLDENTPEEVRAAIDARREKSIQEAKSFMQMTDEERQKYKAREELVNKAAAPVIKRVKSYWDNQIAPIEAQAKQADNVENYGSEDIASVGSMSTKNLTNTFAGIFGEEELENVAQEEIQEVKNKLDTIVSGLSVKEGEEIPVGVVVDAIAEMNGGIDNVGGFMGWFETIMGDDEIQPIVEKAFKNYQINKLKREELANLNYQRDLQLGKLQREIDAANTKELKKGRANSANRGKGGYQPSGFNIEQTQNDWYSKYVGESPQQKAIREAKEAQRKAEETEKEFREKMRNLRNNTPSGNNGRSRNPLKIPHGY